MTRSRFAGLNDEKAPYPPPSSLSRLEKEIQSWEGFPWALRKEDLELWNAMIKEVRERFGEAIEASGKDFTTEPFFMALLLAHRRPSSGFGPSSKPSEWIRKKLGLTR